MTEQVSNLDARLGSLGRPIRVRLRFARVLGILLVQVLLALLLAPAVEAQTRAEDQVKAAFVFNISKYVEWPHGQGDLLIGYLGDDKAMGETLDKMLSGKLSGLRPIRVLLNPDDETVLRCDIVYLTHGSSKRTHKLGEKLRGISVLTLGDTPSFLKDGGMIGLITAGDQIQMHVNVEAAKRAGLKISSRLLNLAKIEPATSEVRN